MLNQITKLRLPDGKEVAFVDWQDKPLFSTIDLLDGMTDTELDAFTYAKGDAVTASSNATARRTATDNDTSRETPGSMSSTEEMLVYAIKPEVLELQVSTAGDLTTLGFLQGGQPTTRPNVIALMSFFFNIRLTVSQKIEQEAPFGYFNTGFGPYVGATGQVNGAGGAVGRGQATNGLPSQEAVRSYAIPVHIGGQEKFRVTLVNERGIPVPLGADEATPPAQNADVAQIVRLFLDGLYKRPVS